MQSATATVMCFPQCHDNGDPLKRRPSLQLTLTYHQTTLAISFLHVHPFFCSFIALNETDQCQDYPPAVSPLYLHTLLHLPGESRFRCLATWSALCYCRLRHSRAILTPPSPPVNPPGLHPLDDMEH